MQLVAVIREDLLAVVVGLVDQRLDLVVDGSGNLLGIALRGLVVPADEHFSAVQIRDRTQLFAHAVTGDHVLCQLCCPVDVVGSAYGDIPQEQGFRHTSAQQRHDLLIHFVAGQIGRIVLWQVPGRAQGLPPGNDGDLPHRVMGGKVVHGDGMAGFVNSRLLQILPGLNAALFRGACCNLHQRLVHVLHCQPRAVRSGCQNRRFVEEVAQVGAGKSGGRAGDGFQIHRGVQLFVLGVNLQNFLPPLHVRTTHMNLPVKAAGTQQCRIQNVRPVGGRQDNHTLRTGEAVHFHQQLV